MLLIAENAAFRTARKAAGFLEPVLKNLLDFCVAEEFLEEDVDLKRLELRLAKECLGVLFWVVEVQELPRQLLVVLANRASV